MATVLLAAGGPPGDDSENRVDFDDIATSLWGWVEFWRATDSPDLTQAVLLDRAAGTTYIDVVDPGTYYYWARIITPAGQPGEFSDPNLIVV